MSNYVVLHCHSDMSNGVTNIDSVTKYQDYVKRAQELNMTALAFSEHGSVFDWHGKKEAIEKAGMKYIHAAEFYITEKICVDENNDPIKLRDNWHCLLIAKNFDGVKEMMAVQQKIGKSIENETGIRVKVTLVEPKTLPRFEGKAKRVIDERNLH